MLKKTFVWEILIGFSSRELRKVKYFLSSPLFNKRKDLIKLYNFLAKHLKSEGNLPSKTTIFEAVYPNETFDYQKLRLAFSRLHKVIEHYLTVQEIQDEPFETEKMLISAYRRRKFARNYQKAAKRIRKKLSKQPLRNPLYYDAEYYLEYQDYRSSTDTGRTKEHNFKQIDDNLTFTFIARKLRQACFTQSYKTVSGDQLYIPLLDEIVDLAQKTPYRDIPAISVYFHFYQLFQPDSDAAFAKFKTILFDHIHHFTTEEFRDIYLAAINFCIKKINNNQKEYFHEALELYKKGLKSGFLLRNGKLSRFTYNNITGIALRIERLDWVENFIQTYQPYLESPYDVTAYNLNMARLEFTKKNYAKALTHLQNTDYDDLYEQMNAKIYQVKIYYELGETETLDSLLKSILAFLRRKKKIGYHYQFWKNLIRYTQKIITVNPYDKEAIAELRKDIEQERTIVEKEWLLEKLRKL